MSPIAWNLVPGFERYGVSRCGKVRNMQTGRTLKFNTIKGGYLRVNLRAAGVGKHWLVHRLVILCWTGLDLTGLTVNHINHIKTDNRLENLELMTLADNISESHRAGIRPLMRGSTNGNSKLTPTLVRKIRQEHREGSTMAVIADRYGIWPGTVNQICKRRTWRHVA